jgi:UDP-N-acetylmuramoyl-tripeptide--D-alanyl-D-alanine ligase
MNAIAWAATGAGVAATAPAALRWLRVAQREHYLAGSVTRFAWRWWTLTPLNAPLGAIAVLAAGVAGALPAACFATAVVVAVGPIGLGTRGRTSKLRWTRRLRTLAGVWLLLEAVAVAGGVAAGAGALAAGIGAFGAPLFVDLALALTKPLEGALAGRFVAQAKRKLGRARPRIVAITGSYGKTSTKGYAAHLLAPSYEVVASPASFNNRAGLARTVNEKLLPSTEVLVAEMGAYGLGEIASLCRFLPPEVSVITAIGPVHLERFGNLETTLAAKAEIAEGARSVVLNTDDERLSGLAERLADAGRRVVRCSGTDRQADVAVIFEAGGSPATSVLAVYVGGELAGRVDVPAANRPVAASNVACALAVALEMEVPIDAVLPRLASLPVPSNRLQVYRSPAGFEIVDDTFNANPAGAAVALQLLASVGRDSGRRAVVTPGMVELGSLQGKENERFAKRCASVATDVVVVGRTNRRALLAGLAAAPAGSVGVQVVANRDDAVSWVKRNLAEGDAVLYENDLPDHFP